MDYWTRPTPYPRRPASNGSTLNWSRSTTDSAFWQCVNEKYSKENPPDFWYVLTSTTARVDTFYANANGDVPGTDWPSKSHADSAYWQLVNEKPCNTADYFYYTNTSAPYETYVKFNVDTTILGATLDSVRVLLNASSTSLSDKNVIIRYDATGTDISLDTTTVPASDVVSDISRPITGLTRATLKTLQAGVLSYENLGVGKVMQIRCIQIQAFSHTTSTPSAGTACWTIPDTTGSGWGKWPDSTSIVVRGTHTGTGYKRVQLLYDTAGSSIILDTVDFRANIDTLYITANGDTNSWAGSDSPNYKGLDERVPSNIDYVTLPDANQYSEHYAVEIDTNYAATLDSIRFLLRGNCISVSNDTSWLWMVYNTGSGWTVLDTAKLVWSGAAIKTSRKIAAPSKAQMAALNIGFRNIRTTQTPKVGWVGVERFFSDNVYHTIRSKHSFACSKAALQSLKIGIAVIDTASTAESLKCSWLHVQDYRPDSTDRTHLVFHDSTDFVIGQMSSDSSKDDRWSSPSITIGKPDSLYRALVVFRGMDSIPPTKMTGSWGLDSAFLNIKVLARTGWPGYGVFSQVPRGAIGTDSSASYPSTGTNVSYGHSDWYHRKGVTADSANWTTAGVDVFPTPFYGGTDPDIPDTAIWATSIVYRVPIINWLGYIGGASSATKGRYNAIRILASREDSSAGRYMIIPNVQPFGGVDSTWIDAWRSITGAGMYGAATYPYFGQDVCLTTTSQNLNNLAYGLICSPSASGDVDSIGGCVRSNTGNPAYFYFALYKASDYSRMTYTGWVAGAGWTNVWIAAAPTASASVVAGTQYIIFAGNAMASGNTPYLKVDNSVGVNTQYLYGLASGGSWPSSIAGGSIGNGTGSLRVKYHTTGNPFGPRRRVLTIGATGQTDVDDGPWIESNRGNK